MKIIFQRGCALNNQGQKLFKLACTLNQDIYRNKESYLFSAVTKLFGLSINIFFEGSLTLQQLSLYSSVLFNMNACIIEVFTDSSIGHFLLSSQALYQFESLSYIYFEKYISKLNLYTYIYIYIYIYIYSCPAILSHDVILQFFKNVFQTYRVYSSELTNLIFVNMTTQPCLFF